MSFPTSGALDNFTGGDENPIVTNWAGPIIPSNGQLRLLSNQLAGVSASPTWNGSWYDVKNFGPDCEVYATMAVEPAVNDGLTLWARTQTPGVANFDCYLVYYQHGAPGAMQLYKWVDGVNTQIGSTANPSLVAGDKIGMSCVGSNVQAWAYSNGVWTLQVSAIDTQIAGAGYLGAEIKGSTSRLDDFGGGTISQFNQPTYAHLGRTSGG